MASEKVEPKVEKKEPGPVSLIDKDTFWKRIKKIYDSWKVRTCSHFIFHMIFDQFRWSSLAIVGWKDAAWRKQRSARRFVAHQG